MSAQRASNIPLPELSAYQTILLQELVEKRLNNTPLAYLTGRQNFMGIELLCDNRALIPRKETEILGNTALNLCDKILEKKKTVTVFDVCCGSGNLGLALASLNLKTKVLLSDLSHEAVDLTSENILFLKIEGRVKVCQSDLFSSFESEKYYGKVDLIVCNPPYISSSKVSRMDSEIRDNEPSMAFDGGMIGMKVIQKLVMESPKYLTPGGWLTFEVGLGQGPFVIQMCEKSNFYSKIDSYTDEAGNVRVIAASTSK
jgi:release factor glutamine methyltransferase